MAIAQNSSQTCVPDGITISYMSRQNFGCSIKDILWFVSLNICFKRSLNANDSCLSFFFLSLSLFFFCCSLFAAIVIAVVIDFAVYLNISSPSQHSPCHVVAAEIINHTRQHLPVHIWFCVPSACSFPQSSVVIKVYKLFYCVSYSLQFNCFHYSQPSRP